MQKSKTKTSTSLTPLETALQQQFKPDANSVRKAFDTVELHRKIFASAALQFGLCALAAKAVVGHGKFADWLSNALAENGNIKIGAVDTARDYIGLAKNFVNKLRDPDKLGGALNTGVDEFCAVFKIDRKDFDIVSVLSNPAQTQDLLVATVDGLNLKQLRQLLREGAEQAEADKKNELIQKKIEGELPKRKIQSDDPAQSDFFNLLDRDILSIDEKIKSPELARLPKDKVLAYADALDERAQMLRDAVDNNS